jgi:hypothetical protein
MEVLARRFRARFLVYSTAPGWFFEESLGTSYRQDPVPTDVGFVQRSALEHDLAGTVAELECMLPYETNRLVDSLAREVREERCRAVLCDISPMGIAVAERAGVPSVLVENFTWPWLYEPLEEREPALAPLSEYLARWFGRATHHVQTHPLCRRDPEADLLVAPISRTARGTRAAIRRDLGIDPERPVVVITLGGVPQALPFVARLERMSDVAFLVTGAPRTERRGHVLLFDNRTRVYMPDFVRASDAVVAKLGYSTAAEVWREGRPLAVITRSDFRETGPLRTWVKRELPGFEIPGADFGAGDWLDRIPELLGMTPPPFREAGGAEEVADYLDAAFPWLSGRP